MPTRYSIDPQRHLVLTVFDGDVSDADLRAHVDALDADPQFDRKMSELVDLRGVTSTSLTSTGIRAVASAPVHALRARRAFVAPSDLLYGLARMYQGYWNQGYDDEVAIFRSVEPALQWLGVTDAPSPPLADEERVDR
jgi:hypothetical protein